MTDTDILVFLKARLDEDEAAALAWRERNRSWKVVGKRNVKYPNGSEQVAAIDVSGEPYEWWEQIWVKRDLNGLADHITRHDPSRVLREVAAKRRVLERHKPVPGEEHIICDIDSFVGHDDTEGRYGDPYPCADVRALASIYSDHPDYNPSWTVE